MFRPHAVPAGEDVLRVPLVLDARQPLVLLSPVPLLVLGLRQGVLRQVDVGAAGERLQGRGPHLLGEQLSPREELSANSKSPDGTLAIMIIICNSITYHYIEDKLVPSPHC